MISKLRLLPLASHELFSSCPCGFEAGTPQRVIVSFPVEKHGPNRHDRRTVSAYSWISLFPACKLFAELKNLGA